MDPTTKEKLTINAVNAWKMWSNWIMAASGLAFTIWLALPADQQQTLIAHLPVPAWLLPIVASVAGIAARLIPQKSISPAVAAAKSEDAPQPAVPGVEHAAPAPAVDIELPTVHAPLPPADM